MTKFWNSRLCLATVPVSVVIIPRTSEISFFHCLDGLLFLLFPLPSLPLLFRSKYLSFWEGEGRRVGRCLTSLFEHQSLVWLIGSFCVPSRIFHPDGGRRNLGRESFTRTWQYQYLNHRPLNLKFALECVNHDLAPLLLKKQQQTNKSLSCQIVTMGSTLPLVFSEPSQRGKDCSCKFLVLNSFELQTLKLTLSQSSAQSRIEHLQTEWMS